MWVPSPDRSQTTAPALALGFHCSVFKKRLPDGRTRRRVEATLVLTSAGSLAVRDACAPEGPRGFRAKRKRWCQPVPSFRARRSGRDPACGARWETTDSERVMQTTHLRSANCQVRGSRFAGAPTSVSRPAPRGPRARPVRAPDRLSAAPRRASPHPRR